MHKTILFYDGVCPFPYDYKLLQEKGMGGTEATCVRIAEALGKAGFSVFVEQHNREAVNDSVGSHVTYCPKGWVQSADYVIALRDPGSLYELKLRFPKAKLYLWSHDLYNNAMLPSVPLLEALNATVITVSQFHRSQAIEVLKVGGYTGQFPVKTIYNPIDDDLKPDATPIDTNKLIWTSSPHKGLKHALQIFSNLLSFNKDFKLHVFNPGYFPLEETNETGVVVHHSVPHREVITHLRDSLCLFYPNHVFPETFGLVLAESNAVGTPVITHRLGAAPEVLDEHPMQFVPSRDERAIIDRVMSFHRGERPTVRLKPQYRLSSVIKDWIKNVFSK